MTCSFVKSNSLTLAEAGLVGFSSPIIPDLGRRVRGVIGFIEA